MHIQRDNPETEEAIRLINKFFPESKGFVTNEKGLAIYEFVTSMKLGNFHSDFSCDSFGNPPGPDTGLFKRGGFEGDYKAIFERLLEHTGFTPRGRCVIVPDASGGGRSIQMINIIVCDHKRVGERLDEIDDIFDGCADSIFVFESGEAMAVDHDLRFFWSKSLINNFPDKKI